MKKRTEIMKIILILNYWLRGLLGLRFREGFQGQAFGFARVTSVPKMEALNEHFSCLTFFIPRVGCFYWYPDLSRLITCPTFAPMIVEAFLNTTNKVFFYNFREKFCLPLSVRLLRSRLGKSNFYKSLIILGL